MRKWKSFISMMMVLAMCVGMLTACGDGDTNGTGNTQSTDGSSTEENSGNNSGSDTEESGYAENKVLGLSFDGNVEDASGKGNHGTLNKEGTYVEGVNGQALKFDGSTYIDLGKSTDLQPSKLTFAVWIKAEGALAGEHIITWFKSNGNYKGEGWYLSCLDDNTPLKLSVGKSAGQPMEIFVSGSRTEFFPAGEQFLFYIKHQHKLHIHVEAVPLQR